MANDFACRNDSCLSSLLWKSDKPANRAGYIPLPVAGGGPKSKGFAPSMPAPNRSEPDFPANDQQDDGSATDPGAQVERSQLIGAMERAGWVQAKAARLLGLTPRQMGYALRKHGIEIKKF